MNKSVWVGSPKSLWGTLDYSNLVLFKVKEEEDKEDETNEDVHIFYLYVLNCQMGVNGLRCFQVFSKYLEFVLMV